MLQRVLGEALVGPILLIAGQQIGRDVLEETGRDLMLLQALRNARRAARIMVARVIRACMVGAGAKWYVRHGSPFFVTPRPQASGTASYRHASRL